MLQSLTSMIMQIPLEAYSHSLKVKYNQDCGKIVERVESPSFMSINNENFSLNFEGVKPGTYLAKVFVQLQDYPSISITEAFNITVASDELRCDP